MYLNVIISDNCKIMSVFFTLSRSLAMLMICLS